MARLAYCYECKTLSKLDDRKGNDFNLDPLLQDWIDRHMHGFSVEDHKGGRVFPLDDSVFQRDGVSWEDTPEVQQVRGELQAANNEIAALRDELKDDALHCFNKHGNPDWPGKPCRDYHEDVKRLGRKDTPKAFRRYLCDFCPYEETVRVQKRWDAGLYK